MQIRAHTNKRIQPFSSDLGLVFNSLSCKSVSFTLYFDRIFRYDKQDINYDH